MSTRITERSSQTHKLLIRSLASRYEHEGYYVKADHINHPNGSPLEINGHTPDLAAYYNGSLRIVAEAETCDTISDSHTREQWKAFSQSQHRSHVIVPKSCLEEAQRQAGFWGITVSQWWSHGS
jgi:hypothetical protein